MAVDFDLNERLQDAKTRGLGQAIPIPLHERLEVLADRVYEARRPRPSKVKLLAALILAAPDDPGQLDEMVRDYEGALVRDALVSAPADGSNVVSFPTRRPGPRPTRR